MSKITHQSRAFANPLALSSSTAKVKPISFIVLVGAALVFSACTSAHKSTRTEAGSPSLQADALSQKQDAVPLTVKITGQTSATGFIRVAVYSTKDGFLSDDRRAIALAILSFESGQAGSSQPPPTLESAQATFMLSPGSYAVAVLHDSNGNGRIDTNFIGIPKESVGTSNNPRPRFRAPNFAESTIAHTAEGSSTHIELMRY